jgi:hypothetical protein
MFDRYRFRGYQNNREELLKSGAMRFVDEGKPLEPREASKILLFLPVGIRLWLLKEVFTNYAGFFDEKGNLKDEEPKEAVPPKQQVSPEQQGEPLIGTLDFVHKRTSADEFDRE